MRTSVARAPAKLILFGEHAVVAGRPAVALPLEEPFAKAEASQAAAGEPLRLDLGDLKVNWAWGEVPVPAAAEPFVRLIDVVRQRHRQIKPAGWRLSVRSRIPSGCGLGSGAAVSTAALRALLKLFGVGCGAEEVSAMVFETEKLHHGTPSGIDNTVIAMDRPILFRKGEGAGFLAAPVVPVLLVIGHTGLRHKTSEVVAEVARLREADPALVDGLFDEIGAVASEGAAAFSMGDLGGLGRLMDSNHALLERLGVSCPELSRLTAAARQAGALGAKLTGAGRGGCMAALVADRDSAGRVRAALQAAGAKETFITGVRSCAS